MSPGIQEKRAQIEDLCQEYGVEELYLFGSASDGTFVEGKSDHDFVVRFKPCTPSEHYDRYFGLVFALEDLLATSVDLIEMDAVENKYLRAIIEETRGPVYGA